MSLLVIGADSMIGKALLDSSLRARQPAIGSTRRPNETGSAKIFVDLADPSSFDNIAAPGDTAIICAGVTKLDACRAEPAQTAKINVTGILALAERLLKKEAHLIYLSTDKVFDGSVPFPMEAEPPRPATEYGRQRALVERELKNLSGAVAIVRLNKVLGPVNGLFDSWRFMLLRGEKIHPFSDLFIAPIPLWFVVGALEKLAATRLSGVFHISGEHDLSYAAIAQIGARALGADAGLIEPINSDTAGLNPESKPSTTALGCDRLIEELDIRPPDVKSTVTTSFSDPATLAGTQVAGPVLRC